MNSRVRALVWEELRVGGPIVGMILAIGVLLLACMRASLATYTHGTWPEMEGYCLTVVLGAPLLCSLLLVLNIRNSGQLGGGLSRRILRMPVGTSAAVTAPLLVRLAGVLLLSGVLTAACRAIYGHGPGGRIVIILASVYLLIQVLDWTRGVVSAALPILGGLGALLLLYLAAPWQHWMNAAAVQAPVTPLFLLAFAMTAAGVYGASLALGAWSRCGGRIELLVIPALPVFAAPRRSGDKPPFSSPWVARFWVEIHETGLFLPKTMVVFYVLGVILRWLMAWLSLDKAQWVPYLLQNTALDETWLLFLLPFGALMAGALAWRFRTVWTARRHDRSASEWITLSLLPGAALAKARLAVAAVNLAVALAAVTAVYCAYFLLHDRACVAHFFADAWTRGEMGPREAGLILLGMPLFFGLLAWTVMNVPLSVLAVTISGAALLLGCDKCAQFLVSHGLEGATTAWTALRFLGETTFSLLLFFPVANLLVCLAALLRLGRISWRSAGGCIAVWALLALALFPFSAHPGPAMTAATALVCLSLASFAAACWPQAVLALDGRWRGPLKRENPEQHRRCRAAVPFTRRIRTMAVLAVVLGAVAWLRWPAEPSAIAALRAAGLPTSLAELDESNPPIPPGENLADRLIAATRAWRSAPHPRKYLEPGQILGLNAQIGRTELIPEKTWTTTKKAWEYRDLAIAIKAHEALHSGLTQCRYPEDARWAGGYTPATLTVGQIGIVLQMQMWVGVAERRADEAVTAVLDQLLLADSLAGQSRFDEQVQRLRSVRCAAPDSQTLLNRMELPETELKRLQEGLAAARARITGDDFIERAVQGQRVSVACADFDAELTGFYLGAGLNPPDLEHPVVRMKHALVSTLNDFSGRTAFFRLTSTGVQWRSVDRDMEKDGWAEQPPYMEALVYSPLVETLAPPLAFSYGDRDSLGLRGFLAMTCLQLDLALAGVAVDRHRVAHGRLPERLEELVPAFLDRVPTDPLNGNKPFAYRTKEDGEFEVYCARPAGEMKIADRMSQIWCQRLNATFTVAPPELRTRPQVADAEGTGA